MFSIVNNRFTFQLIFISILTLFVFHIFNDLDLDSQYFVNINAVEIANDDDDRKERIDLNYIFDSSEYFEEDNVPQNNNININNNINKNNQIKQELEEQTYNQIKKEEKASSSSNSNNNNNNDNKKYEFTSIESKNNENYDIKSNDYVTFNARINLNNIEKDGFLRIVGYINGQSFNEDIQLSEFSPAKNRLDIKFNVLKDTEIVSLGTSDEFFVCAYHIKDIEIEYDSILYFDCNEAGVQDSDGKNTINVFKPSSMVYNKSRALYDEIQLQGQQYSEISKPITDNVDYNDDKVLLKIISPLSDRKNTKELKIAAMVKGQIQTETIKDVQQELAKSNDDTITRTFTFDRNTDIGQIQLGDRFHACVSSDDLNPPEGQECEKRLVKKFNSPNPLPAR
jgi:hypothetical protein